MNNSFRFFAMITLGIIVFINFQIKGNVQQLVDNNKELSRDIAQEIENINVLQAEWSYLNRHMRLLELQEKYLQQYDYTDSPRVYHIRDYPKIEQTE